MLSDHKRRALTSAIISKEAIGTASSDDQQPAHFDLQDRDRSRRQGLDWDDLNYFADYKPKLTGVLIEKSKLVRMYLVGRHQIP